MIKISTAAQNSIKYITHQTKDISRYGEKGICKDYGITEEIVSTITPFRRLSKKPSTLSEPQYFIKNFEQKNGKDYLPANWTSMCEEEKVDFIVKERYSRLVTHKIMSNIQAEPVEHHYSIGADGELLTHDVGDKNNVFTKNLNKLLNDKIKDKQPEISIHNHPKIGEEIIMEHIKKTDPAAIKNMGQLFSYSDIANDLYKGMKSYLIDSFGNKFLFVPKKIYKGNKSVTQNTYFDIKAIDFNNFNSHSDRNDFFMKFDNLKEQISNSSSKNDLDSLMLFIKIKAERYKKVLNLKGRYNMYKNYIEEKAAIGKLQIL